MPISVVGEMLPARCAHESRRYNSAPMLIRAISSAAPQCVPAWLFRVVPCGVCRVRQHGVQCIELVKVAVLANGGQAAVGVALPVIDAECVPAGTLRGHGFRQFAVCAAGCTAANAPRSCVARRIRRVRIIDDQHRLFALAGTPSHDSGGEASSPSRCGALDRAMVDEGSRGQCHGHGGILGGTCAACHRQRQASCEQADEDTLEHGRVSLVRVLIHSWNQSAQRWLELLLS